MHEQASFRPQTVPADPGHLGRNVSINNTRRPPVDSIVYRRRRELNRRIFGSRPARSGSLPPGHAPEVISLDDGRPRTVTDNDLMYRSVDGVLPNTESRRIMTFCERARFEEREREIDRAGSCQMI